MSGGSRAPRVTLGIATYNRETYLAQAITSALEQEYENFEVLVVDDGSSNPKIAEVLAGFDDSRLRVVRHPENRGIAESYNTMVSEGRGELIAMLGDDDVCLPGRISRSVEIFDSHPDTGVVHGDALVIDSNGDTTGRWDSADFTPAALMRMFLRSHNYIVDPTRMVHRRVYETVGGYDSSYRIAQDLHFWLRAAPRFRFRHCPGGPLISFRRHGENTSDESSRQLEIEDVERALGETIDSRELRDLVPELDWAVLERREAERQALERLADALENRALPLPNLAARVRQRASDMPVPGARPARNGRKLMITSFGFNDSGGGTTVPRLAAKELVRRGWDVTVFHAATRPSESGTPYEVIESQEDGVRLLAVHNRPHGIWDLGHPLRELDDPPITAAFAAALDRLRPEVVHFHNLHNLGGALIDQTTARGLPSFFSTHNYWLICPRAYLMTGTGEICPGPGDGSGCASCVQSPEPEAHRLRLEGIRARVGRGVNVCLAVSEAVRRTLIAAGYPAEMIDVVRQGMPHDTEIWENLGRDRTPGRVGERLTVAFLGSAYPHKGPQLLIDAAQRTQADVRVRIHGEVPEAFAKQLLQADERGVVELCGSFQPSEIERLLAAVDVGALPSIWWDCAPLAAAECLAARVPVLAPRLGGLAEAVTDEVDGLTFRALDAEDLAHCLDRLANEQGLLERLQAGITPPRSFGDYVDELEAYYSGSRPGMASAEIPADRIEVRWQGDHGLSTSLSIINARVTERLPGAVQRITREQKPLDRPLAHAADVEVRHQWPPDLRRAPSGRLAIIQPWEFGAIPLEWIEPLQSNVDELWVPSESVREMYLQAGIDPRRVVTVPNGVDLECFSPEGERYELPGDHTFRFLFVGGLIWRKGPDLLLEAWKTAFAGRADVVLLVKDFGADGVYRDGEREAIAEHAACGELPRIEMIEQQLTERQLAGLYRAADVLVHPYRGEGFAMPVLEAMACATPAILTGGGPTDEFCPAEAAWRIRSRRSEFSSARVGGFDTAGRPWVLEPDLEHLIELLHLAADDPAEVARRGALARQAAESYSWDAIAERYSQRIRALSCQPPVSNAGTREFDEDVALRLLATPAWRGEDRLAALLESWSDATGPDTDACLYLLADPRLDGSPQELEQRILACDVDLERSGDVTVLIDSISAEGDRVLHASVDAYIPLHGACDGHLRIARAAGNTILEPGDSSISEYLQRSLSSPAAA